MKRITTTLATFALAAVFTGTPSAFALQDPAPQPVPEQQESRQVATATGQLTKVDLDAMTITLEGVDGKAWTFRYTDDTEVTGGQESVAGLATQAGTVVTVHFEGDGEIRTATKIEVAE